MINPRQLKLNLLALFISTAIILLLLEVVLRVLEPQVLVDECTENDLISLEGNGFNSSRDFGWTTVLNHQRCILTDRGVHGMVQHNNKGLRMNYDIDFKKPKDKKRILLFGDSFLYGYGNDQNDTISYYLQQMLGPQWEVLNFGVSGYGLDNSYSRYMHEGRKYNGSVVVYFSYSNDPGNILFTDYMGYSKPIFSLDEKGSLKITPNPNYNSRSLKQKETYKNSGFLERHSHLYVFIKKNLNVIGYHLSIAIKGPRYKTDPKKRLSNPLTPEDSSIWVYMKNYTNLTKRYMDIHFKVLDDFVEAAKADNETFIITNIPGLYLFNDNYSLSVYLGEFGLTADDIDMNKFDDEYKSYSKSRNITFISLLDDFKSGYKQYLPNHYTGHYNGKGNKKIADAVYRELD